MKLKKAIAAAAIAAVAVACAGKSSDHKSSRPQRCQEDEVFVTDGWPGQGACQHAEQLTGQIKIAADGMFTVCEAGRVKLEIPAGDDEVIGSCR